MEEKIETKEIKQKKKNKTVIILTVILVTLLLGVTLYISYSRGMLDRFIKKETKEEPKQEEKLSEEEINNLRKDLILDEKRAEQTSLYFSHNVSIDTMTDELVNYLIKKYGDQNQLSDKIESWTKEHNNDVGYGDSVIFSFSKQALANMLKSTFNTDKDFRIKESVDYIYQYDSHGIKYDSNNGMLDVVSSSDPSESGIVKTNMIKYEQNNGELYLYEKVMICYYGQTLQSSRCTTPNNRENSFVKITDDSKILTSSGGHVFFDYDYIFEKYEDKMSIYKTTFKKGQDGKYYWYSSEIVNE